MFTNYSGHACSLTNSEYRYGPYLKTSSTGEKGLPKNPITHSNKVRMLHGGSLFLKSSAKSNKGGWVYDRFSGKLIADHKDYDHL